MNWLNVSAVSLKHGAVHFSLGTRGGLFVFCVALKSSARHLCVCCYFCLFSLLYNVTHLESFAKIYFSFSLECLSISFFLFFSHSPKNGFQTWKGKEWKAREKMMQQWSIKGVPSRSGWLRLGASTAGVAGLIPAQGAKILHASWCDCQKKNNNRQIIKNKCCNDFGVRFLSAYSLTDFTSQWCVNVFALNYVQ